MLTRLQWALLQMTRQLWFRATAFSVLAVATALVALWIKRYIPADIPAKIGADAVDSLLNILAASMLSVTIFSLSTLVAALGSATSNVTPRATRLLTEDHTAQNALSTFLGTFLFSLVGIIALQTGLYGDSGRVVLYVVTLGVIALIVVTLLRWISHVSKLGRVGQTTQRVEEAATDAMRNRHRHPYLGGQPFTDVDRVPEGARAVYGDSIGYLAHIDMSALSKVCEAQDCHMFVNVLPGAYVVPTEPIAWLTGDCDDEVLAAVREAFTVDEERSFDQDPRFGVSVLSEIASRALSPAMNDPGTAIDVIGRMVRLLNLWAVPAELDECEHPRVHVPPILVQDLFDDAFTPIARDGAATVEVALRLQKALRTLSRLGGPEYRVAALRHSAEALLRAEQAMTLEADRARVRVVATELETLHAQA